MKINKENSIFNRIFSILTLIDYYGRQIKDISIGINFDGHELKTTLYHVELNMIK